MLKRTHPAASPARVLLLASLQLLVATGRPLWVSDHTPRQAITATRNLFTGLASTAWPKVRMWLRRCAGHPCHPAADSRTPCPLPRSRVLSVHNRLAQSGSHRRMQPTGNKCRPRRMPASAGLSLLLRQDEKPDRMSSTRSRPAVKLQRPRVVEVPSNRHVQRRVRTGRAASPPREGRRLGSLAGLTQTGDGFV